MLAENNELKKSPVLFPKFAIIFYVLLRDHMGTFDHFIPPLLIGK